jgi:hypothetical protein
METTMRFPLCMNFTIPRDGDGAGQGVGAPAAGPGENGPDGQEGAQGPEGPEGPQDQQTAFSPGFSPEAMFEGMMYDGFPGVPDPFSYEGPMPTVPEAPDPIEWGQA